MDTIGDLLTRIRNAALVSKRETEAPWSRTSEEVCRLLVKNGYLAKVSVEPGKTKRGSPVKRLVVKLAYTENGLPLISGIKRISKPGLRHHVKSSGLPVVLQGYGTALISTSSGVMSVKEAKEKKIGGEVLCHIW